MSFLAGEYDVIVVGAGHAGCEASLACARMGKKTLLITLSLESIGYMPCNPSIGGSGKGHLVREIDALGGQMGLTADNTLIQMRMLNETKGPAVHSLRAQSDKYDYHREMKRIIERQENLDVVMDEVVNILRQEDKVCAVETILKARYNAKAVILCTGVYLKSKVYIGDVILDSGPLGLMPANLGLSDNLKNMNLNMRRFKTGTPARVHRDSIDILNMQIVHGEPKIMPFSFMSKDLTIEQEDCYLVRTNENTHKIIQDNIKRSAMYGGYIDGVGPRYCPSIEDKVIRFNEKPSHQFFVEPEGRDTKELYISGFSTSMPYDVQIEMYRSVKGMESAHLMRPAYAIEYDCIDPLELKPTLEVKKVKNLFSAGQFNGTSGYEEAAAQGLIAGINAVLSIDEKEPFILDRSQAYIGVLIDDLVTKGTNEPYRIMTSRAEYRLLLRQDNADDRLTSIGYEIGLVTKERYEKYLKDKALLEEEIKRLETQKIKPSETLEILGDDNIRGTISLRELLKRPEIDYRVLEKLSKMPEKEVEYSILQKAQIIVKYQGYIDKQLKQVEQFKKLENKVLSSDIDYSKIEGLRLEAKQKLNEIKPLCIGQASRISGVSPADISVLLVYIENKRRMKNSEKE